MRLPQAMPIHSHSSGRLHRGKVRSSFVALQGIGAADSQEQNRGKAGEMPTCMPNRNR